MTESTKLAKWNPFTEFDDLQDQMRSLFSKWGNGGSLLTLGGDLVDWTPAVDVTEDDNEFVITADLPDVKKDQVKVTIDDGMLTIRGERQHESEEKKKKYHRVERSYGRYQRSFSLPQGIKREDVAAQFKDGVLTVHLPKGEGKKPDEQEIEVR